MNNCSVWECEVCVGYHLWDIRRVWVMRFNQPVWPGGMCTKGLRRYKNVTRQQDPWWCNTGALVQWCVVKLMRCSKQLLVMFPNPLLCSIPLRTRNLRTRFYSFGNKDMATQINNYPSLHWPIQVIDWEKKVFWPHLSVIEVVSDSIHQKKAQFRVCVFSKCTSCIQSCRFFPLFDD
jgi:hypothetical protein